MTNLNFFFSPSFISLHSASYQTQHEKDCYGNIYYFLFPKPAPSCPAAGFAAKSNSLKKNDRNETLFSPPGG